MPIHKVETRVVYRTLLFVGPGENADDMIADISIPENGEVTYKEDSFEVVKNEPITGIIDATHTSIWDGGMRINTPCKFDPETFRCFDIQQSTEADALVNIDAPHRSITFNLEVNGEVEEVRLTEDDGVTFDH